MSKFYSSHVFKTRLSRVGGLEEGERDWNKNVGLYLLKGYSPSYGEIAGDIRFN